MSATYSSLDPEADRPAITLRVVDADACALPACTELSHLNAQITQLQRRRDELLGRLHPLFEDAVERVMEAVVGHFHVTRSEILGRTRPTRVADARHVFMVLVWEITGQPDGRVAEAANRCRASCSYARRGVRNLAQADGRFRSKYNDTRAALGLDPLP